MYGLVLLVHVVLLVRNSELVQKLKLEIALVNALFPH